MHANTLNPQQVANLKRGVRGVLVFGILTSITANVIHSLTRPDLATLAGWQVYAGLGLSALAPIVLFVSTEMVTRIPVHSKVLGWVRLGITLAIAGFSAWISYWHMEGVAVTLGETSGGQYIYPLIIDGMMIVATISLIELGRLATVVQAIVVEAETQVAQAAQVAATQTAQARKCQPGCTCGRHARKVKVTRKARKAAALSGAINPVSPAGPMTGEVPTAEEIATLVA
jgi:hypothetical protein